MPAPVISREEVIERLTRAFRESGYQSASLARLSEATGLGKASLYHYFPGGKEQMAETVLDHVNDWLKDNVLLPLAGAGTPMERLNRMILELNDFYQKGRCSCLLDLLAIGDAAVVFGKSIKASIQAWESAIAGVLVDAGLDEAESRLRAEDALIAIQGALVVARAKNSTDPFTRTLSALPARLLS
ncbi:MAG: TetR/AcrR family transcriptional regulator [Chromatiales bacterium]|nr:TetR/AcrR family transcriptional regulator [Chromatiales bacterium]